MSTKQANDLVKPVFRENWLKQRIMWPVATSMLIVVSVSLAIFIYIILDISQRELVYDSNGMRSKWNTDQYHHDLKLSALGFGLKQNSQIRTALQAGDRERLLELVTPAFETFKKDYATDTMAIVDAERRVLVRFHMPEVHGDQLNFASIIEAESTGRVAIGLAFGFNYRLVNRVVTPIFEQERLLGYIIIGETFDHLLRHLDETFSVKHLAFIDKNVLDRLKIKKILNEKMTVVDFRRFPSQVLINQSIAEVPEFILNKLKNNSLDDIDPDDIIPYKGNYYALSFIPITSINNERMGTILTLRDITEQRQLIVNSIILATLITLLATLSLFYILYRVTQYTETQLNVTYAELKKTQIERDKGQLYWDDAFNAIDNPVFIHDNEFRVVRANRAYAEKAGMAMQDVIGKRYYKCFPISEKPLAECVEAQQSNVYDESEHEIRLPDGTIYLLRGFVTRDKRNAYLHSVHIMLDITSDRKKQEQFRETALKLNSIMRAVPVGVGLVQNRVLRFVNNNICKMMGYSHEELTGLSSRILYPDDEEYERVGRVKYESINKTGSGEIETRMQRKDGRIIDVFLRSSAIDRHNLSKGVTFSLIDITERKQQQEKLQQQLDELLRFEKVSIGREQRIAELKDEISRLKNRLARLDK